MIQISASPELCYVLWCMKTAFDFFLFATWVLFLRNAVVHRDRKLQRAVCVFFILVAIGCILCDIDKVSAWYNILAKLKGW